MMHRRSILLGSAAAGLGACATFDASAGQVATDVKAIADALQESVAEMGSMTIPGLTQATLTAVAAQLSNVQALATQIAAASTTAAQQPLVQKISTYVSAILAVLIPVLSAIPAAQGIAGPLLGVQALLPAIFALVGMIAPPAAARPTMTAAQARVVVYAMAAKVRR
jgi:hypothetical protein